GELVAQGHLRTYDAAVMRYLALALIFAGCSYSGTAGFVAKPGQEAKFDQDVQDCRHKQPAVWGADAECDSIMWCGSVWEKRAVAREVFKACMSEKGYTRTE